MADESIGRPVGKSDLAARLAYADQFCRCTILIGREHDAECRDHRVEGMVGKGQCLGIGLTEFDVKTLGRGALAPALQQFRDIIGGNDVAPAAGCRECDIAISRGHVQHALSGAHIHRLA